jgi:hypothetical protein
VHLMDRREVKPPVSIASANWPAIFIQSSVILNRVLTIPGNGWTLFFN